MRILLEPANTGSSVAEALRAAGLATAAGLPTHRLVAVRMNRRSCRSAHTAPQRCRANWPRPPRNRSPKAPRVKSCSIAAPNLRAFVRIYVPPPPHLSCFAGRGPDTRTRRGGGLPPYGLARLLVDHRPAYANTQRFPGANVILAAASSLREVVDLRSRRTAVGDEPSHLAAGCGVLEEVNSARCANLRGAARSGGATPTPIARELGPMADELPQSFARPGRHRHRRGDPGGDRTRHRGGGSCLAGRAPVVAKAQRPVAGSLRTVAYSPSPQWRIFPLNGLAPGSQQSTEREQFTVALMQQKGELPWEPLNDPIGAPKVCK